MADNADLDQLASEEANRSGSTLFAKAGYIRVQQNMDSSFTLLMLGIILLHTLVASVLLQIP